MGNKQTKKKSSAKEQNRVRVARCVKDLGDVKRVLLLYKASPENTEGDIVDYFCDALNQVNPPGCVEIKSKNALNVFGNAEESVRIGAKQWVGTPNNVLLVLCLGKEDLSRELFTDFTDSSGALQFSNIFPVCFGTEVPSEWPEAYCLGVANPEKIKRPNDFEGDGLDTLVAAIRGVK